MHTLYTLLVVAATACAIAHPPGPTAPTMEEQGALDKPYEDDYDLTKEVVYSYEDSPRVMLPAEPQDHDYLDKEIERLSKMENEEKRLTPIEIFYQRMSESSYPYQPYSPHIEHPNYNQELPRFEEVQLASVKKISFPEAEEFLKEEMDAENIINEKENKKIKPFALTPLDEKFFEPEDEGAEKFIVQSSGGHHEGGDAFLDEVDPRQTRQNPISRTKNLVADNLDRLKAGFTRQEPDTTNKPGPLLLMENPVDAADSIYGVALIAAVGAALSMTIVGFAFGWYTLSKKAKAAADVDYPAYGVTGPTIDTSGDRKLAHSAHMYHYQHQKQQIIAMERSGMDQRNGSISDPESEEENEEGDYTVYECPGFATTGEMEVKNPMFSDEPTPATPGKCEVVKPQPKD